MTMRFQDPEMTRKFVALCKSMGLHGTIKQVGKWQRVDVTGFVERKDLTAAWIKISTVRPRAN